jgi:hypothetical protein
MYVCTYVVSKDRGPRFQSNSWSTVRYGTLRYAKVLPYDIASFENEKENEDYPVRVSVSVVSGHVSIFSLFVNGGAASVTLSIAPYRIVSYRIVLMLLE